ncbi:unnamed protein product, partial [Thlaspi arvense]
GGFYTFKLIQRGTTPVLSLSSPQSQRTQKKRAQNGKVIKRETSVSRVLGNAEEEESEEESLSSALRWSKRPNESVFEYNVLAFVRAQDELR